MIRVLVLVSRIDLGSGIGIDNIVENDRIILVKYIVVVLVFLFVICEE